MLTITSITSRLLMIPNQHFPTLKYLIRIPIDLVIVLIQESRVIVSTVFRATVFRVTDFKKWRLIVLNTHLQIRRKHHLKLQIAIQKIITAVPVIIISSDQKSIRLIFPHLHPQSLTLTQKHYWPKMLKCTQQLQKCSLENKNLSYWTNLSKLLSS